MLRLLMIINAVFLMCSIVYAEIVGKNGNLYPIEERNAYEEIIERAKRIDWASIEKKYKQTVRKNIVVNYKLERAREDRTFYVDPTYTLPVDMIDAQGRVIYPKGFTFNPLDYIVFREKLVFINGNSVDEIHWIKKQQILYDYNTIVLAVSGDIFKIGKLLNKEVYKANDRILERFKIQRTPSIVEASGRYFIVKEVGIYGKDQKDKKN